MANIHTKIMTYIVRSNAVAVATTRAQQTQCVCVASNGDIFRCV